MRMMAARSASAEARRSQMDWKLCGVKVCSIDRDLWQISGKKCIYDRPGSQNGDLAGLWQRHPGFITERRPGEELTVEDQGGAPICRDEGTVWEVFGFGFER